jgi:hypothetical protein
MKFMKKLFSKKIFILGCVGVLSLVLFGHETLAATGTTTADNPAASLAQILSLIVNLITFFIMLMINYMGDLFGVDMITGDTPMQVIRPMWVVIRNITNIIFIGILVFLVFSNLFGINNWSVKEKLPKVIIALVAINFSLLAFKVALDVVNVGTVTILSIPQTMMQNKGIGSIQEIMTQGYTQEGEECNVLTDTTTNGGVPWTDTTKGVPATVKKSNPNGNYPNQFTGKEKCTPFYARMNKLLCDNTFDRGTAQSKDSCLFYIDPMKIDSSNANSMASHNLMAAFAVYFFRIEQLPALAGKIQSWDGVVMNVLFSTIMASAIIVALLAVFAVMLVRVVFMWISMVFSPIFIAAGIMGVSGGSGDLTNQFVTHLIVPIKVAAVFAVTYIMMSAMVEFSTSNMQNEYLVMGPALSLFGMGISGLLWQIATIGIFWKTAFWALDGTAAKGAVDFIKGGAESLAGVVGRWATVDRPIFPGKNGDPNKVSLRSIATTPKLIENAYNSSLTKSDDAWREAIGIKTDKAQKALNKFSNALNDSVRGLGNVVTLGKEIGGVEGINQNRSAFLRTVKPVVEKLGLDKGNTGNEWRRVETMVSAGQLTGDAWKNFIREAYEDSSTSFTLDGVSNVSDITDSYLGVTSSGGTTRTVYSVQSSMFSGLSAAATLTDYLNIIVGALGTTQKLDGTGLSSVFSQIPAGVRPASAAALKTAIQNHGTPDTSRVD